ncbi:hypothetical protein IFR05_013229 [Cadophora sp. M221]|nr:hypothetical protein IFR05_013229 [Cadophora sp. M221]
MDNEPFTTLSAGGMQAVSRSPSASLSDISVQLESSPASSAATKIFPNKGRSRYKDIQVLLLRWEEDTMGVQYELDDLATCFAEDYGFKTETWLIPNAQPHLALMGKAFKMVQEFGMKDNLLIVYYAGHGGMNSSRQPLWTCTGDPNSPYLQWYTIQTIFEQAEPDVLLLLDCCAAASSAPADGQCNSVTETIAACGFETWAPQPGRHSFTNTLIAVLDDWQDRASFTAAMLHCEILNRLRHEKPERRRNIKNFECRRTPIHILSTIDTRAGSIEICRRKDSEYVSVNASKKGKEPEIVDAVSVMDIDSTGPIATKSSEELEDLYIPDSMNKIFDTGETALPQVLISLALEEEQLLDLDLCRKWLQQFPALAKHAKIQVVYKSNSTLMAPSIPVLIWDWLPDDMACPFIAYVHLSNLLNGLPVEPVPTRTLLPTASPKDVEEQDISTGSTWQNVSREFADPTVLEVGIALADFLLSSFCSLFARCKAMWRGFFVKTEQPLAAQDEVRRAETQTRVRRPRQEHERSIENSLYRRGDSTPATLILMNLARGILQACYGR